jgi:hypothetical protein
MTGSSAGNSPERRARRHLADLRARGSTVTETDEGVLVSPPAAA